MLATKHLMSVLVRLKDDAITALMNEILAVEPSTKGDGGGGPCDGAKKGVLAGLESLPKVGRDGDGGGVEELVNVGFRNAVMAGLDEEGEEGVANSGDDFMVESHRVDRRG